MADRADAGPTFVPGLVLAEGFYRDAVLPALEGWRPDLEYSAALIGSGSEVLGFDTRMSTDHHWGPRVMLFFRQEVLDAHGPEIVAILGERLPRSYQGYPTSWSAPDPKDGGVQHLCPCAEGAVHHRVELHTLVGFFRVYLGTDGAPSCAAEWLTVPHQKLRSLCDGRVFRDDLGLEAVRARLAWYPHDISLYVLACAWSRIGEEEHLAGRAGLVGDEIGSFIIASRLVRDIMRLAFLMERVWPPYPKWFGTAFARLRCAPVLAPILTEVVHAHSWTERDGLLGKAFGVLAEMHNALGVTPRLDTVPSPFHGRPFTVIHGDRFAGALRNAIRDDEVRRIASRRLIGSIDLVSDSTDLLEDTSRRTAFASLYQ